MPDEELFTIRLPDGTQHNWTANQIVAYTDSWQAVLCQGEQPVSNQPVMVDGNIPPSLAVNADGHLIFDEASLAVLDEHIRKVIREEIDNLMPHIIEQVGARMVRQIRMQGTVR